MATPPAEDPRSVPGAMGDPGTSGSAGDGDRPRARRSFDGAWIGGVCTGLAKHLGWSVTALRVMFVVLLLTNFVGLLIYAALWLLLPMEKRTEAPGLESAERLGMRQGKKSKRRIELNRAVPVILLALGLLGLMQAGGIGVTTRYFWPLAFAAAGVALVWRTADAQTDQASSGPRHWYAPLVSGSRLMAIIRIGLGMALIGGAVGLVLAMEGELDALPRILTMAGLLVVGVALVAAPWLYQSRIALRQAREEKVRADERADMAAHLHDSVLQTLALIQRQANDPKAVATLARRQERELRTWLYGDVVSEASVKAALQAMAADVDDEWGMPVEVVCVGDCQIDDDVTALIRAAREAMVNAAKHSGSGRVDVFAEIVDDEVQVFVRDRGQGFDPDDIAEDRQGIRGSIQGRMERHGGRAEIRSTPGEGTEVRLFMPVPTTEKEPA